MANLDKGKHVIGFFPDIKKTFDSIDHSILINKIVDIGVCERSINLFKTYLSNRIQKTKVHDTLSSEVIVNAGIPQGTVLGPLLFLVYINGLLKLEISGKLFGFADDTAILFSSNNMLEIIKIINIEINIIKKWLDENFLLLNLKKTFLIKFSLSPFDISAYKVFIQSCDNNYVKMNNKNCDCSFIPFVEEVKYLGVAFDCRLKFDSHIQFLLNKLRKMFHNFKILRNILQLNVIKSVYYSLVQSLLTYEYWHGVVQLIFTSINYKLLKIQL